MKTRPNSELLFSPWINSVCVCSVWVPCVALPSGGGSSAGSSPLCGSPVGGVLSPLVFLFPVASVTRLASRSCSRSRSNRDGSIDLGLTHVVLLYFWFCYLSCNTTHTTTVERRSEKQCRRRGASSGQKTRRGIEKEKNGRRRYREVLLPEMFFSFFQEEYDEDQAEFRASLFIVDE